MIIYKISIVKSISKPIENFLKKKKSSKKSSTYISDEHVAKVSESLQSKSNIGAE